MSESLYLLTICLPLGTILLIFGMRYAAAAKVASAKADNAAALAEISTSLDELKQRLAAVEKILKDVE